MALLYRGNSSECMAKLTGTIKYWGNKDERSHKKLNNQAVYFKWTDQIEEMVVPKVVDVMEDALKCGFDIAADGTGLLTKSRVEEFKSNLGFKIDFDNTTNWQLHHLLNWVRPFYEFGYSRFNSKYDKNIAKGHRPITAFYLAHFTREGYSFYGDQTFFNDININKGLNWFKHLAYKTELDRLSQNILDDYEIMYNWHHGTLHRYVCISSTDVSRHMPSADTYIDYDIIDDLIKENLEVRQEILNNETSDIR